MCGINGILYLPDASSFPSTAELEAGINAMNDTITHRGPDGEGVYVNGPVALGHRRLSILDLSDNGAQPMFNEDRSIVITYNGELYNYLELKPDLLKLGHVFKSKSDTEVIIHAYEEYGVDCVHRFNGMWAFAIYDFKKNLLFVSRDRMGVKPFFYYHDESLFIFSSEIKSILKYKNISEANLGKVYDYLAYGYRTNNGDTYFKGINELKSAHNLIVKNGKLDISRYWDLPDFNNFQYSADFGHAKDYFMDLFKDSVRLRFRSDVPVAVLLSGGLDSTSITKVIDNMIDDRSLEQSEITAYSAVFPGYELDESKKIQEFIKTCRHIQWKPIYPDSKALMDSLIDITYGFGEPIFNATAFAHWMLMKEIHRAGVKVVLNGQGSDEAFCGYGRYIIGHFLIDVLSSRPADFKKEMLGISRKMGYSYVYIISQIFKALLPRRQASYLRAKYQEGGLNILTPRFVKKYFSYFQESTEKLFAKGRLYNYLKFNLTDYAFNQILHYEDHSAMQSSVEIRSPFIDYRLMEFAFGLPIEYKFTEGVTKRIIREAFKDKLPDSIINDHMKIGFNTPLNQWMQNKDFRGFITDTLETESFKSRSLWDSKKVSRKFAAIERYPDFPFWRVLNLELWARSYGITNL